MQGLVLVLSKEIASGPDLGGRDTTACLLDIGFYKFTKMKDGGEIRIEGGLSRQRKSVLH